MITVGENLRKMFSLEEKVILITGAAGSIGTALSHGLNGAGAKLAVCDVAFESLCELERELNLGGGDSKSFFLDVADLESVKKCVDGTIEHYGRIDVLINCAGINKREGFLDVTESVYDRIMDVNLKGLYFISQETAKHMIKTGCGNIINIASHNSVGMLGGCSVYGATKSAVAALTRSMAVEWAQYGIRANAIAPGHILTALTQVTWDHPERGNYLKERIALERPGLPEELVGVCVMLASDASCYMSGAMIHVDGGCLAGGKPWPYDTAY